MNWKGFVWMMVFASLCAIQGCSDDSAAGTGGSGGSSGAGGSAGAGGAGGEAGTSGSGGASGTGGTDTMNTPPEATIVNPAADSGLDDAELVYDGFDDDMGLWYKDLMVEGLGEDAEDGTLSGAALVWKTNQNTIQSEVLGTGATPTLRLYSNLCTGTEHSIRLEVTDSDGTTTISAPRIVFIWTLC